MRAAPLAKVVGHRRRRAGAAKWLVVAHVNPAGPTDLRSQYGNLRACRRSLFSSDFQTMTCWAHLEAVRWPHGPVCAHCGSIDNAHFAGRAHYRRCNACKGRFRATHGTPFEGTCRCGRAPAYRWIGRKFPAHLRVNHSLASMSGVTRTRRQRRTPTPPRRSTQP